MIPTRFEPMGRNEPTLPDNQLWYYAPEQVTLYTSTEVVSHTFADGRGVLTFASAVITVDQWMRGTAITMIRLPEGIVGIYSNAFYGCSSLALTKLPARITSIGNAAFRDCGNLALTSLPSGVSNIGSWTFGGCSKLAITRIPAGVTAVDARAFYGCTNLTSITFAGTPTSIDANAFQACTNITDIYVPWAESAVENAPWGATSATIHYNS